MIARLAVATHLHDDHISVTTSDPRDLEAQIAPLLPFEPSLPDRPDLELVGGRRCALGPHPVLFSVWREGEQTVTIIQLHPADFDLPMSYREIRTVDGHRVEVLVTGDLGYAIVRAQ